MGKVYVKLNRSAVREMLRSEEMQTVLEEQANQIVRRCGDGYEVSTSKGKNRANTQIETHSWKAYYDNLKNNTVLKALK